MKRKAVEPVKPWTQAEINREWNMLDTLLRDAETRMKEALAWEAVPRDAAAELARMATCLYGATETCNRLRKHFERA